MGHQSSAINAHQRAFIERQKIFFVATAAPKGRVNVSPKGMATLRVLGMNEIAYLDCTGSGSETRAHLLASDDKRLTVMFCAFEGAPLILRLYGISIPVLRVAGGFIVAMSGWELLKEGNRKDVDTVDASQTDLMSQAFYPMTLPLTTGPGPIAVMIHTNVQPLAWNIGNVQRYLSADEIDT